MSAPAVTIDPDATVPMAAKLMARHGIKRLPVVDDQHRLVGNVSRADLLRLFLRDDETIRREVAEQMVRRTLWVELRLGRRAARASAQPPMSALIR